MSPLPPIVPIEDESELSPQVASLRRAENGIESVDKVVDFHEQMGQDTSQTPLPHNAARNSANPLQNHQQWDQDHQLDPDPHHHPHENHQQSRQNQLNSHQFQHKPLSTLPISHDQIVPVSGALSGFVSGVAVCPLDVAKTRLQLQGAYLYHQSGGNVAKYHAKKYEGLFSTMSTIWKEEKLRGLYRGIVPITLGYFPSWMIYFTIYEHCKQKLRFQKETVNYFVSAISLGLVSTTVLNPIWVVKTRLMLQMGHGNTIYNRFDANFLNSRDYYNSTWDCFRKMYRNEGLRSFYSGLLPSYFGLVHVLIHFPLYENFKKFFKCTSRDIAQYQGPSNVLLAKLIASSLCSKMILSGITYPHEILRTRLQIKNNDRLNGAGKITLVSTFKSIWLNQGVRGFYAGFLINLTRTVPLNLITLVSFDVIKTYLEGHIEPGKGILRTRQ